MNKVLVIAVICLSVISLIGIGVMVNVSGPAPNSGDGVSDGSGLISPFQNGEVIADSKGPSLCAGDGISDGSCW
jgi:hypothetical protein